MKGSVGPLGGALRLGVGQNKSKSAMEINLASRKSFCICARPSATSAQSGVVGAGAALVFLDFLEVRAVSFGNGSGSSAGGGAKLLALLSMAARAFNASGSSGRRWRMLSYSRMAEES